jgi:hypothetical protein
MFQVIRPAVVVQSVKRLPHIWEVVGSNPVYVKPKTLTWIEISPSPRTWHLKVRITSLSDLTLKRISIVSPCIDTQKTLPVKNHKCIWKLSPTAENVTPYYDWNLIDGTKNKQIIDQSIQFTCFMRSDVSCWYCTLLVSEYAEIQFIPKVKVAWKSNIVIEIIH